MDEHLAQLKAIAHHTKIIAYGVGILAGIAMGWWFNHP